jgi:peptidoglycan/LPS O-acetylase OafA/YrhL
VLSGFLITAECAQFGAGLRWPQIRDFYVRRFWRIAPAYCVVILLTIVNGAHVTLGDDVRGAYRSDRRWRAAGPPMWKPPASARNRAGATS